MEADPRASCRRRAHLRSAEILSLRASDYSTSPREIRRIRVSRRTSGRGNPLTARVLQVVDVYDALTTDRPYKKAFSITDALQTMKEEVAKGWWDPRIFDQFERLIRSGTADFLSRGAVASAQS